LARQELLVATSGVEHVIDEPQRHGSGVRGRSAALAALGDSDRVISVGSMSKLFWGGLRIGSSGRRRRWSAGCPAQGTG